MILVLDDPRTRRSFWIFDHNTLGQNKRAVLASMWIWRLWNAGAYLGRFAIPGHVSVLRIRINVLMQTIPTNPIIDLLKSASTEPLKDSGGLVNHSATSCSASSCTDRVSFNNEKITDSCEVIQRVRLGHQL